MRSPRRTEAINPPTGEPSRAKRPSARNKKARKATPPALRSSARLTSSVYSKTGASTRTYAATPASSPESRGEPRRIRSAQSALPSVSPRPAPKNALKASSSVAEVGPTCAVPCAWRRNAAARPTPSPAATTVAIATREGSRRSLMTLVCRSGAFSEICLRARRSARPGFLDLDQLRNEREPVLGHVEIREHLLDRCANRNCVPNPLTHGASSARAQCGYDLGRQPLGLLGGVGHGEHEV